MCVCVCVCAYVYVRLTREFGISRMSTPPGKQEEQELEVDPSLTVTDLATWQDHVALHAT